MMIFGCFRLLAGAQFFGSLAVMMIRGSLLSVSLPDEPPELSKPSDDDDPPCRLVSTDDFVS